MQPRALRRGKVPLWDTFLYISRSLMFGRRLCDVTGEGGARDQQAVGQRGPDMAPHLHIIGVEIDTGVKLCVTENV